MRLVGPSRVVVALALAGAAAIAAARPAGAAPAAVSDVAWWSRNPLAQAPQGGFQVGAAPDGPIRVAEVTPTSVPDDVEVTRPGR